MDQDMQAIQLKEGHLLRTEGRFASEQPSVECRQRGYILCEKRKFNQLTHGTKLQFSKMYGRKRSQRRSLRICC